MCCPFEQSLYAELERWRSSSTLAVIEIKKAKGKGEQGVVNRWRRVFGEVEGSAVASSGGRRQKRERGSMVGSMTWGDGEEVCHSILRWWCQVVGPFWYIRLSLALDPSYAVAALEI